MLINWLTYWLVTVYWKRTAVLCHGDGSSTASWIGLRTIDHPINWFTCTVLMWSLILMHRSFLSVCFIYLSNREIIITNINITVIKSKVVDNARAYSRPHTAAAKSRFSAKRTSTPNVDILATDNKSNITASAVQVEANLWGTYDDFTHFFYSNCLTRKSLTSKTRVKITEYNIRNGAIRL